MPSASRWCAGPDPTGSINTGDEVDWFLVTELDCRPRPMMPSVETMTTEATTTDLSLEPRTPPSATVPVTAEAGASTPLVLGAMFFGTAIDQDTSFALLDRFVERGGSWIDTADCYCFWASPTGQGGDSERLLGRWLAARPAVRDRIRISTKVGAEPLWAGSWPHQRMGLSRRAVHQAFAGSLERLGVDHVDMLWLHMEDRATPIEETVDAIGELTAAGIARRVGASNHPAWRVERARAHARETRGAAHRRPPAQPQLPGQAARGPAPHRGPPLRPPQRRAPRLRH